MDIQKQYEIPFPVDVVFSAWISPEYAVAPVTAIEIDLQKGGVFRLTTGSGENAGVMEGRIVDFKANEFIQYTWHWGGPGDPSLVDVRFSSSGNTTILDINHSGLDSPESVAGHDSGWDSYIQGLCLLLEEQS